MYISASTDLKFRSWPDSEPDLVYSPSSQNNIIHVSWCNDNNYVAILPQNYQPEIISTRNKSCVKLVHTVQAVEDVTAVAFQKTTKKILGIGTGNGDVALYDTKHRYVSRTYNNPGGAVEFLDFDPNDHCLAVACTDGTITLNSLITETNGEILKLPGFAQPTALCYHPTNNASLATGSNKGEIILWDTISGCKTFFTQSHCAAVNGLIITSSGSVLISVGQDHKLCIYDLNISECLFRNSLPQPLTAISGHSNGSFIAVGAEDGMEYLYDMRMLLDPVHTYREHTTRVNRITFENNFEDYGDFSEDTSIKTGYTMNCSQASEVSKCQSVDSSKEHGSKLKEEVMQTLHSHMHDLTKKMKEHFCLFSNFVDSEFNILQNSLEEKYDFLKMPHMEGDIRQY